MASLGEWFWGNLRQNLGSLGFRQLLLKFVVFEALLVLVLYWRYAAEVELEHPLAAAVYPAVQLLGVFAVFAAFAWSRLDEVEPFPLHYSHHTVLLGLGLVFMASRFVVPDNGLTKALFSLGFVFLFLFIFGVDFLKALAARFERQIIYAAILFLYIWFILGNQGAFTLEVIIKQLLWNL